MSKEKDFIEKVTNSGIAKSEIYDLHERFKTTVATPKNVRTVYVGYCSKLIANMSKNGATEEELKRAILFSIVVLDSIKKSLSIEDAKRELDISALNAKYS